jgi:nucleoside-diphosphate kinase
MPAVIPERSFANYWKEKSRWKKDFCPQVKALSFNFPMEKTVVLLKPDCVQKGLMGEVIKRFEGEGFLVKGCKMMQLDEALLRDHYAHLADLPFFPEILGFMQSAPIMALALEGDEVIQKVRDLIGPTDSTKADPGTVRGDLGEDKMRNVVHASDSAASAQAELNRFFDPSELLQ